MTKSAQLSSSSFFLFSHTWDFAADRPLLRGLSFSRGWSASIQS